VSPVLDTPNQANSRRFVFLYSLAGCFHYTGPLRNSDPLSVPFPFERLTGQPLIMLRRDVCRTPSRRFFTASRRSLRSLDVQVLSHGGGMNAEAVEGLPGSPLVWQDMPLSSNCSQKLV